MTKVLIVGFGNPLRADDGIGWTVATQLADALGWPAPELEIRSLHQLVPELVDDLAAVDAVVFIDASATEAAGVVRMRELRADPHPQGARPLTHHLTPEKLLAMAREYYGREPRAFLVTVAGRDFGYSEELSPEVRVLVPKVVAWVAALLRLWREGRLEPPSVPTGSP